MLTDPKRREVKGCKRKPPANRYSKESNEAKKLRLNDPKECAKQLSNSSFDRLPSVCFDSKVSDTPELASESATPTSSKKRPLNLYKVVHEDVETDSETEEVCTSDSEEVEVDMESEGHGIIDIWVFLEQTLPLGEIVLIKVERKGLGSTFSFCSNKKCNDQTSFYSSDVATAGNNLTVHCMNHHANLAVRSIGCDRSLHA